MVYSEKFYIGFSDVGSDLGITNTAILRLFENDCCLQGEAVGDGIEDSPGRWFLTAYHVKVFKRPRYNDWVTVNTWSREMKGVSAAREFELRSAGGELLAAALSNWARLNISTGKLERMPLEDFAKYESEPERHNFDEAWIQKLHDRTDYSLSQEVRIGRNLIDPNGHINNVYYLDLAVNALPEEVYRLGEANEFEITYRKAVAYGETVLCLYGEDADSHTVAIRSKESADARALIKLYK